MIKLSRLARVALFVSFPFQVLATTHQVSTADGQSQTITGAALNAQPGDVIEVEAGSYGSLSFTGLRGAKNNPITIINSGGVVECISENLNSGLSLVDCRFVHLTGTGDAGAEYGFNVDCAREGRHSVNVVGGSSFIEIDHIEVSGAGFAGFNVKDEPTASGQYNRGNFLMEGIELHHNFVHDTGGEGFYIGHTFYNGYDIGGTLYYPHLISGLRIYNNHVMNTGAEGIQVGSTIAGLELVGNLVENPGIDPFADFQNNGIQIGMSAGHVVGNIIRDAAGNGLIILSQGDLVIASNQIERAGNNGMFVDDREASPESIAAGGVGWGPGFRIFNNTLIDCGQDLTQPDHNRSGVRLYAVDITDTNHVYNNLVIGGPGENYAVSLLNASVPIVEKSTRWSADAASLGLIADGDGVYTIPNGSDLIDAGAGIQRFGVFEDVVGAGRSAGTSPDIGAWEFPQSFTSHPTNDSSTGNFNYNYRLFTPDSAGAENPLPLIIYIHGLGEQGTDNHIQVERHIQPLINTARGPQYCAYLLAPQSPTGWFDPGSVVGMINNIIDNNPIDTSRIYVTGISAGGQGTWRTLAESPNLFAAGVPISGVQHLDSAPTIALNGIPIWAFHGDNDGTVNVSQTRTMISLLEADELQPRYTEIPGMGHGSWSNIFNENPNYTGFYVGGKPAETIDSFYAWLFRQTNDNRQEPPPPAEKVRKGSRFLFDFGNASATTSPDSNGLHWNSFVNVTGAGKQSTKSVDSTGDQQALSLSILDPFSGGQTGGIDNNTLYPGTAQVDTWWSGNNDDNLAKDEQAEILLEGFPENAYCDLTFFASRTGNDGGRNRVSRYTIGGQFVDLDATDNTSNTATLTDVYTGPEGEILIKVHVSPDSSSRYAYIGVLDLTVKNDSVAAIDSWVIF